MAEIDAPFKTFDLRQSFLKFDILFGNMLMSINVSLNFMSSNFSQLPPQPEITPIFHACRSRSFQCTFPFGNIALTLRLSTQPVARRTTGHVQRSPPLAYLLRPSHFCGSICGRTTWVDPRPMAMRRMAHAIPP